MRSVASERVGQQMEGCFGVAYEAQCPLIAPTQTTPQADTNDIG